MNYAPRTILNMLKALPDGVRLTRDDETRQYSIDYIAWGSLPSPEHPQQYDTLEECVEQEYERYMRRKRK